MYLIQKFKNVIQYMMYKLTVYCKFKENYCEVKIQVFALYFVYVLMYFRNKT